MCAVCIAVYISEFRVRIWRLRVFADFGGIGVRTQHTFPEKKMWWCPSLNYHDHTQHASFSCWLLDALVKSPLA